MAEVLVGQQGLGQVPSSKYTKEKEVPSPVFGVSCTFPQFKCYSLLKGNYDSIQPLPLPGTVQNIDLARRNVLSASCWFQGMYLSAPYLSTTRLYF